MKCLLRVIEVWKAFRLIIIHLKGFLVKVLLLIMAKTCRRFQLKKSNLIMALRVVKQLEKVIGHRIFKVSLQAMKRMDKKFRSKKLRN